MDGSDSLNKDKKKLNLDDIFGCFPDLDFENRISDFPDEIQKDFASWKPFCHVYSDLKYPNLDFADLLLLLSFGSFQETSKYLSLPFRSCKLHNNKHTHYGGVSIN